MTFSQLLTIVEKGYSLSKNYNSSLHNYIFEKCHLEYKRRKDPLAYLLIHELFNNFDSDVKDCIQLGTAIDILNSVKEDIDMVLDSLSQEFYKPE